MSSEEDQSSFGSGPGTARGLLNSQENVQNYLNTTLNGMDPSMFKNIDGLHKHSLDMTVNQHNQVFMNNFPMPNDQTMQP